MSEMQAGIASSRLGGGEDDSLSEVQSDAGARCGPRAKPPAAVAAAPPPPAAVQPALPPAPVKPAPPKPQPVAPPPPPPVEEPRVEILEDEPPVEILEDESPADADGLGRLVKDYTPRRWWLFLALFGVLFVLNLPWTLVAFLWEGAPKWGIASAMIPNAIFLIGVIICGAFAGFSVKRWAQLYQRGLINHGVFSSEEVRWTEVTAVYLDKGGIFQATDIHLDLQGRDRVTVPSVILKIEELADKIIEATAPLIKPRIEKALDRGESVAFGENISVTPKGLEFRPNGEKGDTLKLKWKEIEGFSLGRFVTNPGAGGLAAAASIETQFRVSSADQPVWICPTANVANFAIFVELIEKRFGVEIAR